MRAVTLLITSLFLMTTLSGCFGGDEPLQKEPEDERLPEGVFITGPDGNSTEGIPLELNFTFSDTGVDGPEPSIGITSSGCMFFVAMAKVMRSCDGGESWEDVANYASAPTTSDPYLWVDPVTDRIFNVQMVGLATTWIGWSDDDGDNWLGNPHDSGPIPLNDHIKLASGPWTDSAYGVIGQGNPTYSEAVYFCYNKLAGIFCYTSFDGGQSFEVGGQIYGLATTNGGLHGAITTAPD
ncbi:MAG: exo-alpha-sialidase, partial [Euryarchaeota archaeon]|nr:exo-alpha-sialidase [Euryarchaeota archaeon]